MAKITKLMRRRVAGRRRQRSRPHRPPHRAARQRRRDRVRQRADQQQGRLHRAARGRRAQPRCQALDRHVQQGDDQGRQAGGADVRPGAIRGRQGGRRQRRRRHDPRGGSRRPVHLRRRVHPLGSRGRQEDPGLQLSRRPRKRSSAPSPASRPRPKSSPSATPPSTRSGLDVFDAAARESAPQRWETPRTCVFGAKNEARL